MKGINLCAECAYYSMKKHRCTRGASVETDPKAPFYDDCPLTEAAPVVHGRWIHDINNLYGCSECGGRESMSPKKLKNYCPNCGAKMDGGKDCDE